MNFLRKVFGALYREGVSETKVLGLGGTRGGGPTQVGYYTNSSIPQETDMLEFGDYHLPLYGRFNSGHFEAVPPKRINSVGLSLDIVGVIAGGVSMPEAFFVQDGRIYAQSAEVAERHHRFLKEVAEEYSGTIDDLFKLDRFNIDI